MSQSPTSHRETLEVEEDGFEIPALIVPLSKSAIASSKLRTNQKRVASSEMVAEADIATVLGSRWKGQSVLKVERQGLVVAAKVAKDTCLGPALETWFNEKSILTELKPFRNRYIANLTDFDGPRLTLYLDYINGRDLSTRRDKNGFCQMPEVERRIIWKDISNALSFIHGHDIIHHDVKPSNIIYAERERRAVLCDFGIATKGPKLHFGGSPSYIAPELVLGEERSHPADIWAFGVTMLFVIGLMPLPRQNWIIAALKDRRSNASSEMTAWHFEIWRICRRIPQPYSLLRSMFERDTEERITASQLIAGVSENTQLEPLERCC